MTPRIGIVGLGRVGLPAAAAYLQAGYEVFGFDRRPEATRSFKDAGGTVMENVANVGTHARIVLVLVLHDAQVVDVVTGTDSLLSTMSPGSTIVCMSTIRRATLATTAKQCAERNVDFVDCPFTGGPARIPTRRLTLIAAAPLSVLETVKPHLALLGNVTHVGNEPGLGQAVKHCNQLVVGVTHAATMEAITLARKSGLDPALVAGVIGSGIAGSDYFRLLSESVLTKKPSPGGLGQMCKDMAIVDDTASAAGMHAIVASAAARYFADALNKGMQDMEGADLIRVVENFAG